MLFVHLFLLHIFFYCAIVVKKNLKCQSIIVLIFKFKYATLLISSFFLQMYISHCNPANISCSVYLFYNRKFKIEATDESDIHHIILEFILPHIGCLCC